MICSFECTFCRDCVEGMLMNVLSQLWRRPEPEDRSGRRRSSKRIRPVRGLVEKAIDTDAHAAFAASIKGRAARASLRVNAGVRTHG